MTHSAVKKKKLSPLARKERLSAWIFLIPGILATIWLRYYPIGKAFYMSLFNYDAVSPPGKFVGIKNYLNLFKTDFYWEAWGNTFVFLLLTLALVFWVPLVQAIFLNEINKGRKLFTTIFLLTTLIPMSVNVIVWKWIWNPEYGVANQIFSFFGANAQLWLSNPDLTKFCIVFPGIVGGGVNVLLYLTAIQGISPQIYEAAALDGCVGYKKVTHIILPNIRFIVVIQLVLTCITTMQILDAPFQFASGGPSGASTSMGMYIYDAVYKDLSYGKSTAASVTLFVIIAILTVLQMKLDNSEAA
ncbi:MAG: sugar ABC transporter permease [Oscillospiraceae bacterium]